MPSLQKNKNTKSGTEMQRDKDSVAEIMKKKQQAGKLSTRTFPSVPYIYRCPRVVAYLSMWYFFWSLVYLANPKPLPPSQPTREKLPRPPLERNKPSPRTCLQRLDMIYDMA